MSLLEPKEYLQNRSIVSINDLSVHYNASPETLEPMLKHWTRKGKLRKETPDSSCGKKSSCSCCTSNDVWYQ